MRDETIVVRKTYWSMYDEHLIAPITEKEGVYLAWTPPLTDDFDWAKFNNCSPLGEMG